MTGRYALEGQISKELLTYNGCIIWHNNPHELEFLFKASVEKGSIRVIELPKTPFGRPFIRLQDHPDMMSTTFPLVMTEFIEGGVYR